MPTDKPRVTFAISEEKLAELELYRYNNKIKNQTQAILSLIDKGLSALEAEKAECLKKSPSAAEATPGEDTLKLLEDLNASLVSMGYIGEDDDLTDQQLDVLLGICAILRATFEQK